MTLPLAAVNLVLPLVLSDVPASLCMYGCTSACEGRFPWALRSVCAPMAARREVSRNLADLLTRCLYSTAACDGDQEHGEHEYVSHASETTLDSTVFT